MNYRDDQWITSRIRMADVKCHCDDPTCSGKHLDPRVRPRTVLMLKLAGVLLRDYDFKLTSVMRCPAHNKAVGGAPDSAHIHNCAVDIVSERWSDIALDAELQGVWSAIIVNPVKKLVHLDLHPSDRVTRGCVIAGRYCTAKHNRRYGGPLIPVTDWNLDETRECPAYVNARYQRSDTDSV